MRVRRTGAPPGAGDLAKSGGLLRQGGEQGSVSTFRLSSTKEKAGYPTIPSRCYAGYSGYLAPATKPSATGHPRGGPEKTRFSQRRSARFTMGAATTTVIRGPRRTTGSCLRCDRRRVARLIREAELRGCLHGRRRCTIRHDLHSSRPLPGAQGVRRRAGSALVNGHHLPQNRGGFPGSGLRARRPLQASRRWRATCARRSWWLVL